MLNPASKIESFLLALLLLFLPTQLGKHFWPSFSLVSGIRVDYLSPTIFFTDVLLLSLFIFFVQRVGFSSFKQKVRSRLFILLFLAFYLETALFGIRPLLGSILWLKLCLVTFFSLYIARYIRTVAQLFGIGMLFVISSFFESLLAIFQYLSQSSLNGWLYYLGERTFSGSTPGIANASIDGMLLLRPYGTFSHPNVLAGFLLLSSLFILFFVIRKSTGFIRYFSSAVLVLNSIAILLTLSRVVILLWFVLVSSMVLAVLLKRRSYKRSIFFAAIAGITLSVVMLPFLKILLTRFAETSFFEEAVQYRVELIADALAIIRSHPLTGVGLGNFIPALNTVREPLSVGLYFQPVHNIFLLIAAETGILGVSLFVWMLIETFRTVLFKMGRHVSVGKEYAVFLLMLMGWKGFIFLLSFRGRLCF